MLNKTIQTLDVRLLQRVYARRHPVLDRLMSAVTRLGNGGAVWIAVGLLLILSGRERRGGVLLICALVSGTLVCNVGIKPLVARLRPCDETPSLCMLSSRPNDYSFPSGHTMSSFTAATVLCCVSPLLGWSGLVLAAMIAFSRLYLGVHYPSDVLVGALLGVVNARLVILAAGLFR